VIETPLVAVSQIAAFYGKSRVLHDVSFTVPSGGITVVIGRNGAGKTTTLRTIIGLVPPRSGSIYFNGREITGQPPYRCFRLGLGYVPEGRQIFPYLTVGENLRVAEALNANSVWTHERIFEYFPILRERWNQMGMALSGGEQQMLAVARALVGNPKLLMLDEPSQGLAPKLVHELQSIMIGLKNQGVTILLVEQNARLALAVSDQVIVLSKGAAAFTGSIAKFRECEAELKSRYLSV
jgi:branched-chain amino acid transport system ATP-binding protein